MTLLHPRGVNQFASTTGTTRALEFRSDCIGLPSTARCRVHGHVRRERVGYARLAAIPDRVAWERSGETAPPVNQG